MNYTVSLLKTKPDCQAAIDIANNEKGDLEYRKITLNRQSQTSTLNSVEIESGLAAATAEASALETVVAGLPEGPTKEDMKAKLTKATYKVFLFTQRKASYGVISLIEREYDIACVDQSLVETDAFIAALTARMNELN